MNFKTITLLALFFVLHPSQAADQKLEAEATTRRFATALAKFESAKFVEEMHSEAIESVRSLIVQVAGGMEPKNEKVDFIKSLGFKNEADLKSATGKTLCVNLFTFSFSNFVSKEAKQASHDATVAIVGSIDEGEMIHVLYRSEAQVPTLGVEFKIPSVVSLKPDAGKLKIVSTTQLQAVMGQLRSIARPK